MPLDQPFPRGRRAAFSVAEVAKLCRLSRARFYDLIGGAAPAMPPPVYDLRTRRPFYTAELAARCIEVRETNIGIDGRFVMFYEQRRQTATTEPTPSAAQASSRRRQAALDPLMQEMLESLRAIGITATDAEMIEAVSRCCPSGLSDERFDLDLMLVRSHLQRQRGV